MNSLPLTIVGNLTRDPELRFTASGTAVVKFTVAHTPRKLDRESGKWVDGEPTFLDCTAWRQLAENIAESVSQGHRMIVTGTLRTERWETDGRNGGTPGEKRSRMVLDVDSAGPELTWATAKVAKATRSNGGPSDDPWATASRNRPTSPAPAGAGRRHDDEEPPF